MAARVWEHILIRSEPPPADGRALCGWGDCAAPVAVVYVTRWGGIGRMYAFHRCDLHRWPDALPPGMS